MSEKWKKKQKLMDEFVNSEGFKMVYTQRLASRKDCEWCDRFKDAEYRYCLHCGSRLK